MIGFIGKYLTGFAAIAAVVVAGKFYYDHTQQIISELTAKNAELKVELNRQIAEKQQIISDQIKLKENIRNLTDELQSSEEYQDILQKKFRENDMVLYSIRKPRWMENIINDGTEKVFRDIESDTSDGL